MMFSASRTVMAVPWSNISIHHPRYLLLSHSSYPTADIEDVVITQFGIVFVY